MKDLIFGLQIRLVQVLSLLAVVTTIFLSRVGTLQNLRNQLVRLYKFRVSGFALPWMNRSWQLRVIEAILWVPCFLVITQFYFSVSDYLTVMDSLIGSTAAVDYGLLTRLGLHAEHVKHDAIQKGFITLSLLALNWAFTLLLTARSVDGKLPWDHANTLPAKWKAAPAAMWEYRIEQAALLLRGSRPLYATEIAQARSDGTWRSHWTVWTKCAIGYQIAATSALRHSIEPGLTSLDERA